MKYSSLRITLLSIFVGLLFASCQKEVLLKKDGQWDGVETTSIYLNNVHDDTYSISYTYTFDKDGTGNRKEIGSGSTDTYSWSRANDVITISFNGGGILSFKVTEDKKKSQIMNASRNGTGGYRYDYLLKLTR